MWKDVGEVITALVPFGLAGLAIAAIVILILFRKDIRSWPIFAAMVLIALIFALDRYYFRLSPETAWFDTFGTADWGGNDLAYTDGEFPVYKSTNGRSLCDTLHEGNLVTCWDDRKADDKSLDQNVKDSNVPFGSTKWCAYKDRSIKVTDKQTGQAPKGRVYVCGRYIRQT
jgi:hypothetical protein